MPWLTDDELPDLWPQAESIEPDVLRLLVDSAREQCEAYATPLAEGATMPERWRLAHLLQVQALWQSAKAGPGDTIGPDGLTVTVYPMDRTVKNLLRPRPRVPVIG